MTIPDSLVACLRLAMEREDLDTRETVAEAFAIYKHVTGAAFEVEDDEEGEAIVLACFNWVADEVLNSLILKGIMEFSGIDESGEVYLGFTNNENENENKTTQ